MSLMDIQIKNLEFIPTRIEGLELAPNRAFKIMEREGKTFLAKDERTARVSLEAYFLDRFLSLDMESPESFAAFVMWYGIRSTFCPLIKNCPEPSTVIREGITQGMNGRYDIEVWNKDNVEKVREEAKPAILIAQSLLRRAAKDFAGSIGAVNENLHEHLELRIIANKGRKRSQPELVVKDIIGQAFVELIERHMAGKEIGEKPLLCEVCGKPIPPDRPRAATCSQECSNKRAASTEERKVAERLRKRAARRWPSGSAEYHCFSSEVSKALTNKDTAILELYRISREHGFGPIQRPPGGRPSKIAECKERFDGLNT